MGEILVCVDRVKVGRKFPQIATASEKEDSKAHKNVTG
jgi:hypothetical protein